MYIPTTCRPGDLGRPNFPFGAASAQLYTPLPVYILNPIFILDGFRG